LRKKALDEARGKGKWVEIGPVRDLGSPLQRSFLETMIGVQVLEESLKCNLLNVHALNWGRRLCADRLVIFPPQPKGNKPSAEGPQGRYLKSEQLSIGKGG